MLAKQNNQPPPPHAIKVQKLVYIQVAKQGVGIQFRLYIQKDDHSQSCKQF